MASHSLADSDSLESEATTTLTFFRFFLRILTLIAFGDSRWFQIFRIVEMDLEVLLVDGVFGF